MEDDAMNNMNEQTMPMKDKGKSAAGKAGKMTGKSMNAVNRVKGSKPSRGGTRGR